MNWRNGQMAQHYGLQEPILQRAWYRDNLKFVIREDGYCELYDLAADPDELRNLASDPDSRATLSDMRGELLQAMQAVGDDDVRILSGIHPRH